MIFNSYVFIFLMMPVSIAGYYLCNRISRKIGLTWLLAVSLFFVGFINIYYLEVLIPSVIINYVLAYLMNTPGMVLKNKRSVRKMILIAGVMVDVIALLIFKYTDFFLNSINKAFSKDYNLLRIILPLGISFYTFQQISFLVDYYRDGTLHCSLLEYAVYVCFYPQFVQGPIVLQSEFIPQLRDQSRALWDSEYGCKGLYRFIIGLAKKVLIADSLALVVNGGYTHIEDVNALSSFILLFGYALQIYFDFSAYSDMAVGLGHMFHFDLPENFDSPYKAGSIDEFWNRWHITLTRFFTQYVYIPLGGSRRGNFRTYINILTVFLLSGIWHGAEWSFVLWGLLHGIAKVVCRLVRKTSKGTLAMPILIKKIITFVYVSLAWVFFRAKDSAEAIKILGRLFKGGWTGISVYMYDSFSKLVEVSWILRLDILEIRNHFQGLVVIVSVLLLSVLCFVMRNSREATETRIKKMTGSSLVVISVLLTWCIISFSGVTDYIYWNF